MTGSIALDVVIGLVFIYTIYSLFTTILVELIAKYIRLRSWGLEYALRRMLDDEKGKKVLLDKFYNQAIIKYLGSGSLWGLIKKPSYLADHNFSRALLETLKDHGIELGVDPQDPVHEKIIIALTNKGDDDGNQLANSDTGKFLASLLEDAQNDIEKFKLLIEQWYNDTMERLSSWYKKWTQLITFFVGLGIAIGFNVDTIHIVKKLSSDPKARDQLIEMSMKLVNDEDFKNSLRLMPDSVALERLQEKLEIQQAKIGEINNVLSLDRKSKQKNAFLGWLLTAFAISLGAPFWFDILNKLMQLRSSLKALTTATGEKPSQPGDQPLGKNKKIARVG